MRSIAKSKISHDAIEKKVNDSHDRERNSLATSPKKKLVSFCFFQVFLLLSLLVGFWGGKSLKGRRKEIKTCFALMYSNAPVLRQVTSMADLNTKGRETSRATSSSCAADSSREG
jgi:hypothetical protein